MARRAAKQLVQPKDGRLGSAGVDSPSIVVTSHEDHPDATAPEGELMTASCHARELKAQRDSTIRVTARAVRVRSADRIKLLPAVQGMACMSGHMRTHNATIAGSFNLRTPALHTSSC